jgi:hypothetical protein
MRYFAQTTMVTNVGGISTRNHQIVTLGKASVKSKAAASATKRTGLGSVSAVLSNFARLH